MKRIVPHLIFICLLVGIAVIDSCKKDPVIPTLTTTEVTNITINSVTTGGVITKDGGAEISARGVCWGTSSNPELSGSHSSDAAGIGSFVSNITNLTPNTLYHIRAYATNKAGTAYGNDISFTTTPIVVPTLTTTDATSITLTTAVSGGNITADGNGSVTARGVCWSTSADPTITNDKTSDGTGIGSFISNLTGLLPGTLYHVRAYATNVAGTGYGNDATFTTTALGIPVLTTTAVTSPTLTSAVSGGNVTADGGSPVTARGVCWSTTTGPTIANPKTSNGTGTGSFTSNITGLSAGLTYYVRAYATNSVGTAYGNEVSFNASIVLVPTLTTTAVTAVTYTTAVSGGNVLADGGGTVTGRGVCWATTLNPTIANSVTNDGTGTGAFVSNIAGLTPGVQYHVRAYAVNSAGTAYGNEVVFTANPIVLPTVTTATTTLATSTSASSGGNVTDNGGGTISARGVCWSTTAAPTTANLKTTDGTGTGAFTSSITGLQLGTEYHVRAYATNSAGTAYGNELTVTTPVLVPTVSTDAITLVTTTTAVSGGSISSDGGGSITAKGVCWSQTANPTVSDPKTTDGTGLGAFVSNLTALVPGTIYHVRAYATNSGGTGYGNDLTLTTNATALPSLTTTAITSIGVTTAASGGNIAVAGAGIITARGVCWSTTPTPTISDNLTSDGTGTGVFTSSLTGLAAGTTYYVRAYATNNAGTGYGTQLVFDTKIADNEGNTYNTVTIGTQVWMKENLATAKYNNGDPIGTTTSLDISGETTPKYVWAYGDNESNVTTYGRLYTFYAVTDARGVCPTGWHIPSAAEWTTLHDYLTNNGFAFHNGTDDDIAKSMATTSGWAADPTPSNVGNDQATNNTSGWSGLPGGFRKGNEGIFQEMTLNGYWGSSSEGTIPGSTAWWYNLNAAGPFLYPGDFGPWNGYSIRCLKN